MTRLISTLEPVPVAAHTQVKLIQPSVTVLYYIRAGESQRFALNLKIGQYVHITAVQKHADVVLALESPDGSTRAVINRWGDPNGDESLSDVADKAGVFKLTVSARSWPLAGSYRLTVSIADHASAADLTRIRAEREWARGDEESKDGTRSGLRSGLVDLQQSLALWHQINDQLWEATTLLYLGVNHYQLGELEDARENYSTALPLWSNLNDKAGMTETLSDLGRVYDGWGYSETALAVYRGALQLSRETGDTSWEAHILHNIGMAYMGLGQFKTGLTYYQRALRVSIRDSNRYGAAHVRHHIGESHIFLAQHSVGHERDFQLAQANNELKRALAESISLHDHLGEATTLNHLAKAASLVGAYPRTLEYYSRALKLREDAGYLLGEAQTLCGIAETYGALGQYPVALETYEKCLNVSRDNRDERREAEGLLELAAMFRDWSLQSSDGGRASTSARYAVQAISKIERLRTAVSNPDLRMTYLVSVHEYYEIAVGILLDLHHRFGQSDFQMQAFQVSEAARARRLRDNLDQSLSPRSSPDTRTNPLIQLSLTLGEKNEAYARIPLRKKADREQLQAEIRNLQTTIANTAPDRLEAALTADQPGESSVTLAETQQRFLKAGTALLEYVEGTERSYLWIVTRDQVKTYFLPNRERLREAVATLSDVTTSCRGEEWRQGAGCAGQWYRTAKQISQLIGIAHLRELIGLRQLLIVPDGALNEVPFAALPISNDRRRVIDEYEVTYTPSMSTQNKLKERKNSYARTNRKLLVVADPVLRSDDTRLASFSRPAGVRPITNSSPLWRAALNTPDLPPLNRLWYLKNTALELQSTLGKHRVDLRLDFNANLSAIQNAGLPQYGSVLVATHALINSELPENSGIVLSGFDATGQPRPGLLQLSSVYKLRLSGQLIFLAACKTATGTFVQGEGVLGFADGFLTSGATTVVGALWDVDERPTATLIENFYHYWMFGRVGAASALRSAQLRMKNRAPYEWAGFTITGLSDAPAPLVTAAQ